MLLDPNQTAPVSTEETAPIFVVDRETARSVCARCPECDEIKPVDDFVMSETVEDGITIKNVAPVCGHCQILEVMRESGEWMTEEQINEALLAKARSMLD